MVFTTDDDTPFPTTFVCGLSQTCCHPRPQGPFKHAPEAIGHVLKVGSEAGPSGAHLPRHEEQKGRLLLFGFVLGNDLLGYWLNQLFGCFGLPVILRICDG